MSDETAMERLHRMTGPALFRDDCRELTSALRNILEAAKHRQLEGVNDQGWISASWVEDRCRVALAHEEEA